VGTTVFSNLRGGSRIPNPSLPLVGLSILGGVGGRTTHKMLSIRLNFFLLHLLVNLPGTVVVHVFTSLLF
jgi:hypothetical protein